MMVEEGRCIKLWAVRGSKFSKSYLTPDSTLLFCINININIGCFKIP